MFSPRLFRGVNINKQESVCLLYKGIKPVIERTFPLEKAGEAQTYFKNSGKLGKIILLPEK